MFVDILVLSEFVTSGRLHRVKIKAYELFASNILSALYKSLINKNELSIASDFKLILLMELGACANRVYQALLLSPLHKNLGTRVVRVMKISVFSNYLFFKCQKKIMVYIHYIHNLNFIKLYYLISYSRFDSVP